MKDCPPFTAASNKRNGAKALFLHTNIITKFQPHCLLTKQHIYIVSVSRYCLGKNLQWLLITSRYPMQKLCLNTSQNNPQEIWSVLIRHILWQGHLRSTEAQRQPLIEHRGGSPFVIIFRGLSRLDLLWEPGLLRLWAPMQMRSVASCLPVGFHGFPDTWCNRGIKRLHVINLLHVL